MAKKQKAKRAKIVVEVDVELVPGHEGGMDVKASLRDAVKEFYRQECRKTPLVSKNGELVNLQFHEEHPDRAGQQWGNIKVSWTVE
jgi:hypothetical protein